jgi:hypothetical protein
LLQQTRNNVENRIASSKISVAALLRWRQTNTGAGQKLYCQSALAKIREKAKKGYEKSRHPDVEHEGRTP